jgi:Protein of unknown function (DUF3047)
MRAFASLLIATSAILAWPGAVFSQNLAPFSGVSASSLHPAWKESGLPADRQVPRSRLTPMLLAGEPVLQLVTDRSYGVLTHDWRGAAPGQLQWRWQLVRGLPEADITRKAGDDAALKVCVFFDQPLADIPLLQRAALSLARSVTGQDLPSATLCYLWDSRYPAGSSGANPYSGRVRYLVLDGRDSPTGQWVTQQRNVQQDFVRLFGTETARTPPVLAVAVGADSDNTQGQSLAYLSQLRWIP